MAGHSKWANIQHRKGAQDAKRGKLFSKLIREITVASRVGGDDPAMNPRLRDVVARAYKHGMKRDTVENAVKRGGGQGAGSALEFVCYEGYGPAGIALLIHGLTDNRNRTVSEMRYTLTRCGGRLGEEGSVAYLFKQSGVFTLGAGVREEQVMGIVLDYAVEDIQTDTAGIVIVYTEPDAFSDVERVLTEAAIPIAQAEVTYLATVPKVLETVEEARKVLQLVDRLEDLDDVQQVYSDASITQAVSEQLDAE